MRKHVSVFLFYLALAIIFTAPLSLDPASRVANDGDPLHISWILAWDAHQLLRDPLALYESNSFYPYESSLAFSEHLIVQALMVTPIQLVTGNALLAQNTAILLTLALAGWAMFLFLRDVFGHEDGALVGGVVFAFNTYMFHEVPRLNVISIQWLPLTALYLYRSLQTGRRRDYVLFGLFYLLQCLSCTYYLLYVSLVLPIWVLVLWWTMKRDDVRAFVKFLVPGAVVAALVTLFSLPYLQLFRRFAYQRDLAEGLDLLDYVRPLEGSALGALIDVPVREGVTPHYLGAVALILAGFGLAAAWRHRVRNGVLAASLITGIVGVVLSLGPTVHVGGRAVGTGVYAFLYDYVPLFRGLRSPERISVLTAFALAVFGAYGFTALRDRMSGSRGKALTITVLVLLPLEHFSGGHYGVSIPTMERAPHVYRWLGEDADGGPVVELPLYPLTRHRLYASYMFYSTFHFRPIVFGRTSFYPPATDYLAWQLQSFPDRDSIGLLRDLGVTTIVVHPRLWPESERGRRLAALRSTRELRLTTEFPELSGGDYERLGLGGELVYTLTGESPDETESLCTPSDAIDPEGWLIQGSSELPAEWAIDRDPETKWKTDRQLPDDYLLLDLGRVETVAAVRLTFTYPYREFPRYVVLRGRRLDEPFETLVYRDDLATKRESLDALLHRPEEAAITLRFEPRELQRLRIRVGGRRYDYALPDWGLPELYLYRSCDTGNR